MKRLILFCVLLFGNAANSRQRNENDDVSWDHRHHFPVFTHFDQCVHYFVQNSFPIENLTAECVAAACPKVTSVCPYNCDGSLNPQALQTIGTIFTSCIQNKTVICGVNLGQLPIVPFSFTTATLIDPSMANGSCTDNPGTGYIQYLNNTNFTFPPGQNSENGPITLQMDVPFFNYQGGFTCDFNLTLLQDVPFLRAFTQVTFPAMLAQANFSVKSTVTIDPTTYEAKVQTLETQQQSIGASNFTLPDVSLPPCIINMFNRAAAGFFDQAPAVAQAVDFLSAYVVSGLRAANQSCAEFWKEK